MNKSNDYLLVLINLIDELDKEKYNKNSLPLKRTVSSNYSLVKPSVQVQTSEDAPLIIYDIEIEIEISKEMIDKWKRNAALCSFMYLIVREEISKLVEDVCARELNNYMVIPFRFEKDGNNRNVLIEFP